MECKTALQLASYLAPGKSELDAEHTAALESHVRACAECGRRIRFAQSFDQRVARTMKSLEVPAGLKARIVAGLTPARPAWYRRPAVHAWAAAAAILVAVGVLALGNGNRVALDIEAILLEENATAHDRLGVTQRWLAKQGVAFAPEVPLDLNLVIAYGISPIAGKSVPMLELCAINRERPAFARVYVVRSDEFDLRNFPAAAATTSVYGFRVEIIRDQHSPSKLAYVVIIYNADSLEPFRDQTASAA